MGSETQSPSEPTVIVMPADASGNSARENAAYDVLLRFGKLPPGRLLCFFDDEDCCVLKSESVGFGKANRGVSSPVTAPSDFYGWPTEAIKYIYPSMSLDDNQSAFDFVTYLHNSSCLDPLGMTMTFAHELRHFVQWATMREVWKANQQFKRRLLEFDTGFESHDLPIERDARIVAKRIAIQLYGFEAVNHYIQQSINDPVNDLDCRNWRFIEGLDVAKPYDVEVETTLFREKLNCLSVRLRL